MLPAVLSVPWLPLTAQLEVAAAVLASVLSAQGLGASFLLECSYLGSVVSCTEVFF